MRTAAEFWIIVFVLALSNQGQAVLDEVISLGGGLDDPTIHLTHGENTPIRIYEAESLRSRCHLEDESEIEDYEFSWISRQDRTDIKIVDGQDLYMTRVNSDTFRYPIFCLVKRTDDGEVYEKQIAIEYYGKTQERTLQINPMPSEDQRIGRIVRKCEILPTPPPSEHWIYTWLDPSGRSVASSDILTVMITEEQTPVTYTCEAKNMRTNDKIIGEFTVRTKTVPTSQMTYTTTVETISKVIEFSRPYEARCILQPTPPEPVLFSWYFKDRLVSPNDRLYIESFDHQTAGDYTCTVRSAYGDSRRQYSNATLTLRLQASTEDHTNLRPPPGTTLITNIGERRELHCEIPKNNRAVRWYLNDSLIDENSPANRTGSLQRIDYLRVSILTIDGVEPFHEGKWACQTDNEMKIVRMIVVSDYLVEVNPHMYVLSEGEAMEIHCSVQGAQKIPNSDLQWFFRPVGTFEMRPLDFGSGGFVRTDDPRAQFTSVVTKYRVTAFDEGKYICREPRGQIGISTLQIRQVSRHTLHISPGIIKVRPGQDVTVFCFSMETSRQVRGPRPRLRISNNRLPLRTTDAEENAIQGAITRIDSSFNGTFVECYSDAVGVDSAKAIILVEDVCTPGYRRCRNGECLESGRFCDGLPDCRDGSDEDPSLCNVCDPIVMKCETYRGQQPRASTYMVHWQCDGEDDCGNGFDESNCQDPDLKFCVNQHYTCPNSRVEIPRSFMCDSENDCYQSEDEQGCREPQILDQPRQSYSHRRGETVTLTCEVGGRPNPRVIWRFNWGCLPDNGSRMTVRNRVEHCGTGNEMTISTLTINNFSPGDDGIYNCEGLNGVKRVMSRDYTVVLRG